MIFLDLPPMHWDETQLLYHALGRLGIEALALTSSIEPYICVGFSQGIPTEVDRDYCREHGIGVFRREIGGGTVFIDKDQLLIQLVLGRARPDVPAGQANFFRRFLAPLQEAYREIGIGAEFYPINDLLVHGSKISGTGGGVVGDCNVLATNMLLDFDFGRMAGALRCPSDAFREAVRRNMAENLTTLKAEMAAVPSFHALRKLVRDSYEKLLGPFMPARLPVDVKNEMERLKGELFSKKWLGDTGARRRWREVKVREGCYVAQLPAGKGGLLLEVRGGRIRSATGLRMPWGRKDAARFVGLGYDEEQIINMMSQMATR